MTISAKKTILATLFALAMMSTSALAAGPSDGLYVGGTVDASMARASVSPYGYLSNIGMYGVGGGVFAGYGASFANSFYLGALGPPLFAEPLDFR